VDVLRVLAVSRSSGALEIRGTRSGVFFLQDGSVTYAEALGIPPEQKFAVGDPRLRSSIEKCILDASVMLLTGDIQNTERPLFRPGRRHWSGNTCSIDVDRLLVGVERQITRFTGLGVEPDDEVRLRGLPLGRTVTFSRAQWALAAELSGPQIVRSLAWRLGLPLGVVVPNVASLITAGVLEPADHPTVPTPPPPAPGLGSGRPPPPPPAPPPEPRREPPQDRHLPHREPGSTPLPQLRTGRPVPPFSAAEMEKIDEMADARALALRLLEGLRRL
jgi:hypothetical protein